MARCYPPSLQLYVHWQVVSRQLDVREEKGDMQVAKVTAWLIVIVADLKKKRAITQSL